MDHDERITWAQFRFSVIAPLVCRKFESDEQKKALRREILQQTYVQPDGSLKQIPRRTLQQWLWQHRKFGFDGLLDSNRSTRGTCRAIPEEILNRAELLRRQEPARSVRTILSILEAENFDVKKISKSTLNNQLRLRGASKQKLASEKGAFQRWEQKYVNALWQADTSVGVRLPDPNNPAKTKATKLIAFIDDASRVCTHAQFYWDEKLPSLVDCFRKALLKRGKPDRLLCDNAFIYHSNTIKLMCAYLHTEVSFCRPYSPQGKGKVEKHFGTIKRSFYIEAQHAGLTSLEDLNNFFWAWLTKEYHKHPHSSLGTSPLERWKRDEHLLRRVSPADIRQALMLRTTRRVNDKTAMIRIDNQWYQADPAFAGATVEVRWQAGHREQIEIWQNEKLLAVAHATTPTTKIDFSRKPDQQPRKPRGMTFDSSKTYRLALVNSHEGEAQVQNPEPDDYLAEVEFLLLLEKHFERQLADEEKHIATQFFFQCSPLKTRRTTALLEQAINAKGKNLHLRYYTEHIRRSTFPKRSK